MKRNIPSLCLLLLSLAVLTSCLSDNDSTVETYSDTAVTAVTLGTLNRYTKTTSSKSGNDTIIKTTLTGANYKLTIDQLNRTISNRETLPAGTDLRHVVISSISTKNSGTALVKSVVGDTLFYIRNTDSLDFTQPRTIRVVATNGTDYRDYTMTLTASSTVGTTFGWQRVAVSDNLAGWTDKKLLQTGDSVTLADSDDYVVGGIMRKAENSEAIKAVIGATEHEIFAMGKDGLLKVCTDGKGLEWRDEQLDDSPTLLPSAAIAMTSWSYAPADSTECILLAGNSDADTEKATLWRKLSRYHAQGQETEGRWVYMTVDGYNRYALPQQEYLSMTYYNDVLLAVGSNMTLLQSRDQGITWKKQSPYALPAQISGSRAAIAADTKGRLWLVTDSGELWMGALR